MRLVSDQVDVLQIAAARNTRLEAERLELRLQVREGLRLAGGSRGPPFHRIGGQILDEPKQPVGRYRLRSRVELGVRSAAGGILDGAGTGSTTERDGKTAGVRHRNSRRRE